MNSPKHDVNEELTAELHAALLDEFAHETEPWAIERIRRVMDRLNAARTKGPPLTAHVLWIRDFTAFTFGGPNIYVSRTLFERLGSDESAAFVLAHEAAHNDLGHLTKFQGMLRTFASGLSTAIVAGLLTHAAHRLHGPEWETEADLYALALCLEAGYNGERCLDAFRVMELGMLDRGDISGVFGPENLLDPTDPKQDSAAYKVQRWLWTRARRYLPLRERHEQLREALRRFQGSDERHHGNAHR